MSEEMNNIMGEEEESMTVTLTYDDGTEEECIVMDIFTEEELGEQEYIALLSIPEGLEDSEEDEVEADVEVMIYRYEELEGDDINLEAIEDENEIAIVQAAFEALLEEAEEE